MSCNNMHKVCNIEVDGDNIVLTASNTNGVSNKDEFCLLFTQCLANLNGNMQIKVNGTAVPLYNKYSIQSTVNDFKWRRVYRGYYVNENDTPYVILINAPQSCCSRNCM